MEASILPLTGGTGKRLFLTSGKVRKGKGVGDKMFMYWRRSTTRDNDEDGEKSVDQPQKRDGDKEGGESFISLKTRNDTPGSLDNSTFEGNVGNWIQQGIADGTLDMSAASFGEVNAQGLPDW